MSYPQDSSPFVRMVIEPTSSRSSEGQWNLAEEGQLSVDVLETAEDLVILSTLAGANMQDIEVSLHNDLLTIRGSRPEPVIEGEIRYFHKECFWGRFSRTIVLPVDVKSDLAQAEYKNGVLTIAIPKQKHNARIPVVIVEE